MCPEPGVHSNPRTVLSYSRIHVHSWSGVIITAADRKKLDSCLLSNRVNKTEVEPKDFLNIQTI